MKSFDEWVDENSLNFHPTDYYLYKSIYEAGQQSKQAEIDELRKRIDDAINQLEFNSKGLSGLVYNYDRALTILKGNTNED